MDPCPEIQFMQPKRQRCLRISQGQTECLNDGNNGVTEVEDNDVLPRTWLSTGGVRMFLPINTGHSTECGGSWRTTEGMKSYTQNNDMGKDIETKPPMSF